jgi:dienelactone hydrolase
MDQVQEQNANHEKAVEVRMGGTIVQADFAVPESACGVVLFAHGSGSSRRSPRNRYVVEILQEAGLATLLMDLLTPEEEAFDAYTAALRFNIGLLATRLVEATRWLHDQPQTAQMRIGYFCASTGAAAALVAAAELPVLVAAVVSRGGRPDLAGKALWQVAAPTLLIVGGKDSTVLELNRQAFAELTCEKRLEIVPDATHLFEEPGGIGSRSPTDKELVCPLLESHARQTTGG